MSQWIIPALIWAVAIFLVGWLCGEKREERRRRTVNWHLSVTEAEEFAKQLLRVSAILREFPEIPSTQIIWERKASEVPHE